MKKLLALILALLMLVSMVACGAKKEETAETPAADTPAETPADDGEITTELEVQDVVEADDTVEYKEHITIGVDAQITTLDPTQKNNVIQNCLWTSTHDTLIEYNPQTNEYEPGLALEWEWIDDVTLQLKLREGVKFHDGTDFNAYDVEATLARVTAGLVANTYDHCDIIDDYTVNTVVQSPNVDWVFVLSHTSSSICSAEAIEADPDTAYVGTGPWKVIDFVSGDSVDLERFDDYWGPLPGTKKLTYRYYGESAARLIALENGEVDMIYSVGQTDLEYAKSNPDIVVEEFTSSNLFWFAFNMEKAPGQDENLRKAVAYAINRDAMVAASGGGEPAYTMWGWNSLGYTTEFEQDYSFNLELAQEYADKATVKEFTLPVYGPTETLAAVLQENLRAIGITMNIQSYDSAGINEATKWGADHDAALYSMATNASGSDMFRLIAYGTTGNRANLHDEAHDMYRLQTESNAEFDEAARIALLEELQAVMHDECIYYGLVYGMGNVAYVKGLENAGVRVNKNYDHSMIQLPLN